MLCSVVYVLTPMSAGHVPMTLGKAIHANFLQQVRRFDRAMASRLHDGDDRKPFTTSPLQGPFVPQGRSLCVQPNQKYWFRVTSVETALSELLLRIEENPPAALRLLQTEFKVIMVSSNPRLHPSARRLSYEMLLKENQRPRDSLHRKVKLRFYSPTAFHSDGQTKLFPEPRLVLTSLWDHWQRFAPSPLSRQYLESLVDKTYVASYQLQTRMQHFGAYRQLGFVGSCAYELAERCVFGDLLRSTRIERFRIFFWRWL